MMSVIKWDRALEIAYEIIRLKVFFLHFFRLFAFCQRKGNRYDSVTLAREESNKERQYYDSLRISKVYFDCFDDDDDEGSGKGNRNEIRGLGKMKGEGGSGIETGRSAEPRNNLFPKGALLEEVRNKSYGAINDRVISYRYRIVGRDGCV
jgi:hypothetical protein